LVSVRVRLVVKTAAGDGTAKHANDTKQMKRSRGEKGKREHGCRFISALLDWHIVDLRFHNGSYP
jgi:hypothetical protein